VTGNSITDTFCAAQKTAFDDTNEFAAKDGLATIGAALKKGIVLVMSIWDDHTADMLWLDAPYPPTKDVSAPGVTRGMCSADSGKPADVEAISASASVTYSNVKWGPINSTYTATGTGTGTRSSRTGSGTGGTRATTAVAKYGQCGGTGYSGSTVCVSGSTCTSLNTCYSQCL
jgi:cellulose 1,4-beta-cellobiosidase